MADGARGRRLHDRLASTLPDRVDPDADGPIVEQLLLHRFDLRARLRVGLKIVGKLRQRFLDLCLGLGCDRGEEAIRELAADRGADLRYLLDAGEPVETG